MIAMSTCIIFLAVTLNNPGWAQEVNQPGSTRAFEGQPNTLSCSLSSESSDVIQWYQQFPGEGLRYIAGAIPGHPGEGADPKSTVNVGQDKKSSTLVLHQVKLADAAIYYCALSESGAYKPVFGSGTRLVVTPKLEESDPSVYKLQSPKEEDRDISACLITDFFPAPIRVGADGIDEHEVNGSIVIVKERGKETPSYGEVIWGKAKEADGCYAEQNNTRFPSESAEAATTCSEKTTGGFETDERLNLLSLTVIGLRVIFLKCVAFNLLFTFHAWSS